MLTIDRLRLQLPDHFLGQAGEIARLAGEELAGLQLTADRQLDRLVLPPIRVAPTAAPCDLARAIAGAIATALQQTR